MESQQSARSSSKGGSAPKEGMCGPCQECGRPYPPWVARNEVWNLVMGGPEATDDPGGLMCPGCFLIKADDIFPDTIWALEIRR